MSEYSQHILQRVAAFIEQYHLLDTHAPTLYVALSGGPDSVALLHILRQLNSTLNSQLNSTLNSTLNSPLNSPLNSQLTALHCNFHLRGEESNRDQRFCEELCRSLGIDLQVHEFDTYAYMQEHHLSLEMAARELRYEWWREVLNPSAHTDEPAHSASPSSLIALGHHQDDSLETLLMNLMRGTGIQGLTGIVAHNAETHVIRPLLCLSRQEILDYLTDNGLNYVTDSTNAENDTLRNQVRNELLPLMQRLLPQARQGLSTTMQHLQQSTQLADLAIQHYVEEQATHQEVDGYPFDVLPSPCPYPYQVEQYYQQRGWLFDGEAAMPQALPLPAAPVFDASRSETFDQDQIHLPLHWRRWQQGDRMDPLGMDGHTKLLSDLFSNAHYLPIQKRLSWVLVDASDRILWVPGLRLCHHARVTALTTRRLTVHYGEQF